MNEQAGKTKLVIAITEKGTGFDVTVDICANLQEFSRMFTLLQFTFEDVKDNLRKQLEANRKTKK